MADAEKFGLPQINIEFKTRSTSAIKRSARGIVAMILKEEAKDETNSYVIKDYTDIPADLSKDSIDYIKLCLEGVPYKVLVYTIPKDNVGSGSPKNKQATILKQIRNVKFNYICAPTGSAQEQQDLATFVKGERKNNKKTIKAVVGGYSADDMGVVNFTTKNIKVVDKDKSTPEKEVYKTYDNIQYTARIAGILAGLALDRSATFYRLQEVIDCEKYEDIDSNIDNGELVLFDEMDGDGVKIARACNSLTTFTTDVGEMFRKIKIVECIDLITDDIRDTFKKFYVGKVINDYNHKMLFIAIVGVYFNGLKGNVLDNSPTAKNFVEINFAKQRDYAIVHGDDVEKMTDQEILEYNTGSNVFLSGRITPVDAMEDLRIDFIM